MAKLLQLASLLTARRVRFHAFALALCLWSAYAWEMSAPGLRDRNGLIKGTDFLHFYTLGKLALTGRGDLLYDIRGQGALIHTLLPQTTGTFYVPLYGPQVSLLFSPFARLSYGWALLLWLVLNASIYCWCCYAVWKTCPNLAGYGLIVFFLAIAFPGFFHLIAWGQSSGLALVLFTLAYFALEAKHPFLVGLAIGSLVFKPQLGLAAAFVFVFSQQWKVVLGAVTAAAAQLAVGWMRYGTAVMQTYFHSLLHVREVLRWLEPRPYQMHSLRAFWSLLVPWPPAALALYLASALIVIITTLRVWRSDAPLHLRFSSLLLATVLISPHLTVYDLVILAPAFLWLGDWALRHSVSPDSLKQSQLTQLLLYLAFPLFLLGPLAMVTHLQLSVIVLAALHYKINAGRA